METTNIGLSPQTINRGQPDEATVYNASASLEVKIHDFDVIGPAIQKGVAAGATSVRGVRFQVADPVGVRTNALEEAVTSAREKADALAGAAGTAVTGVIQIREGGSPSLAAAVLQPDGWVRLGRRARTLRSSRPTTSRPRSPSPSSGASPERAGQDLNLRPRD